LDLSIIIVNWNTEALLQGCLKGIFSTIKEIDFEVFVVDNGSWDGSPAMVRKKFPEAKLIQNNRNLGFAKANNIAIKRASGRYLALVNSDTVITEGAAEGIVRFLDENPRAGAVAPQYISSDGAKQNSFDNFPSLATELVNKSLLRAFFPGKYPSKNIDYDGPLEVESLIGAFLVLRAAAIKKVGLLDEGYFFFLEETDLCLRLKNAGWRIVHIPWIKIYHLQGKSKDRAPGKAWIEYYRSNYRFFRKNRAKTSYSVLRVLKLAKLIVNLLLTGIALLLTVFLKRSLKRKLLIYSQLLWWHLKLCPQSMGLREVLPEKVKYLSTRCQGIKWKVKKGCEVPTLPISGIDFKNLAHSEGVQLLKDSKIKTVALARLDPTDGSREFLIKHYKCPGIAATLSYIVRRSKAEKELLLSRKFAAMGIPTILPIAIGVDRKFRILSGNFVISERVKNAVDLEKFFTEGKHISTPFLKKKVIEEYGKFARKIHDSGIVQSDFDPNNILIERFDDEDFRLYLIDYERVKHFRRISHGKRVWSIAKLNRFSKGITVVERMRFLKAYVGDRPLQGNDFRAFVREILAVGRKVMKRDIRRAAKNSLKKSSKIGSAPHRGNQCYYRKSHLKQKKYSGPDIRAIVDEIFKLDFGRNGATHGCRSFDSEIDGVRKRLLVFIFPPGRQSPQKDRARDAWRVLNSLLKIGLPALFPVALIEGSGREGIKDLVIAESPGLPVIQKKLGQIQFLKGHLPDAHLEKIKSVINSFGEESHMKDSWYIIGCKTNSAKESYVLAPGKIPMPKISV
jgi:GT2 family glycosyltransferase